jgi:hypothetical protein
MHELDRARELDDRDPTEPFYRAFVLGRVPLQRNIGQLDAR